MSVNSSRELAKVEGQCTAAGAPGWIHRPRKVSTSSSRERRGNWEEKGKFREGENRKGGPYIMDRWKNILKKESGGR